MGDELKNGFEDMGKTLKDGIMGVIDEISGLVDELLKAPGQMLDVIMNIFNAVKKSLLSIVDAKAKKNDQTADKKEYNTPEPEILPDIPGTKTEKFINLLSNTESETEFKCGTRFMIIILIFLMITLFYFKSKNILRLN